MPIPVVLAEQAVLLRHLRFVFLPGSLGGAVHLAELTLACDWGPDDDTDDP